MQRRGSLGKWAGPALAVLSLARPAHADDVPRELLRMEVAAPMTGGLVPSALPPRFVLLDDGQVFVGGTSAIAVGQLDKAELAAIEQRLSLVRKLPGLGASITFGEAATPRRRLQSSKNKLDLVVTGDPTAAPPALQPLASLVRDLEAFHHRSLRPYEPASFLLTVREAPLTGGCRAWTVSLPIADALAAPRTVAASDVYGWPTGAVPAAVCDGGRRFVATLRPLLPGERP